MFNVSNNSGHSETPQIMYSGNNIYVAWIEDISGSRDIFFKKSSDNGCTFGPTIDLGIGKGGSIDPKLATNGNNIYLIWEHTPGNNGAIYFTRSSDSGASFEKVKNLGNNTGFNGYPQIVASDNNVYATWHDATNGIYFTRSSDSGASFGDIMNLSNYSGLAVDPQIAVSQNNNVYVVWTNNSTKNEEILFKRYIDYYNTQDNKTCNSSDFTNKSISLDADKGIEYKIPKPLNIAIVPATFTEAAYDKSFYMFYEIYEDHVRKSDNSSFSKYTDLLYSRVTKNPANWSGIDQIVNHLKWLTPKSNIDVLGDQDIDNGTLLFSQKGANRYDVIILEHQEYVSQKEYDNLKKYVSNGGLLFLLNGNIFFGEVKYDEKINSLTFVKGHGFTFDGETAWRSDRERWAKENTEWIGSNYKCCFGWDFRFHNDPFGITHVEEQYITNPKAEILLDYNATADKSEEEFIIATYALEYKKGTVLTLGIWTVNKLFENERFLRFFDSLMFQYALRDS